MYLSIEKNLFNKLKKRKEAGNLRTLLSETNYKNLIDFSSNDYLGIARIKFNSDENVEKFASTGSRLISGNYKEIEELEKYLAGFHKAEAALIFNSGYDANLGLISSVADRNSVIFYDEFVHSSIKDGIRLSFAQKRSFKHNNLYDLEKKIIRNNYINKIIIVESIYSMDGDIAPLKEINKIAKKYSAALIVDEAHSTGICGNKGEGLSVEMNIHNDTFARIHTFGKAMGSFGAAVLCSSLCKNFLINFSRNFIYTTALPYCIISRIYNAYKYLEKNNEIINKLKENIKFFNNICKKLNLPVSLNINSPIQICILKGNKEIKEFSYFLESKGFNIKAILSPTVPQGKERIRITIHSYNTKDEIINLCNYMKEFLEKRAIKNRP